MEFFVRKDVSNGDVMVQVEDDFDTMSTGWMDPEGANVFALNLIRLAAEIGDLQSLKETLDYFYD